MRKNRTPAPVMIGSSRLSRRSRASGAVSTRRRTAFWLSLLFILVVVPALLAIWAFFVEPGLLTVNRYSLTYSGLPASWDGRVVAFFSDAHLGPAYPPERLARVADLLEREKPDLILFGGDLIDSKTPLDRDFSEAAAAVLRRMQAPLGQYAVAGNHDNRLKAEYRHMQELLDAGGFTLLDNSSCLIDGLWLGGLAESYFGQPDVGKTYSPEGLIDGSVEPDSWDGSFRLLLMHQPDYAAALPAGSANLILSGHSHNGQITLFGHPLITVLQGRECPFGHYRLGEQAHLVVSRGLGTFGIPARLCAPPELVLITLVKG